MSDIVRWLSHDFTVHLRGEQWNNVAGIYIFAGLNQAGHWVPCYIGQCDSFQNRIPSHEQWDTARSLGATHVHARTVPLAADRDNMERALIQTYHPTLNSQFR
jgi:hypothetical protein